MNLNSAMVIGRLTREVEFKQLPSTQVANFNVVANKRWKGADGEWKESPAFIDCKAWGNLCNQLQHAAKGDHVMVVGSLTSESWQAKDGTKKSKLVITADQVMHLVRAEEPPADAPPTRPNPRAAPAPAKVEAMPEEDIPF